MSPPPSDYWSSVQPESSEQQTSGMGILARQQVSHCQRKTANFNNSVLIVFSICSFIFKSLREKMGLDRCRITVSVFIDLTLCVCVHVFFCEQIRVCILKQNSLTSYTLFFFSCSFFPQGSAAAPIAHSVLEFFLDFDIPLYELYGMSECTGPQTLSLPQGNWQTGGIEYLSPMVQIECYQI